MSDDEQIALRSIPAVGMHSIAKIPVLFRQVFLYVRQRFGLAHFACR
ncbi:hypothetical protein BN1183_CC_00300 [Pantoea ananatis]|nr:hypothetical protein BN1183_CC_00300 [Pantoea ananatis]